MDEREAGLERLESARQILRESLATLDRHFQLAKTGSADNVRALLHDAERELELALRRLKGEGGDE